MNDELLAAFCPQCHKPLKKIRYPHDSMFNRDQWESMRAGDWWCETCPNNGRGVTGAYFWDREVAPPAPEPPPAEPPKCSHGKLANQTCAECAPVAYQNEAGSRPSAPHPEYGPC